MAAFFPLSKKYLFEAAEYSSPNSIHIQQEDCQELTNLSQ